MTSAEFSEAAAAALCLPSPACTEKLGEVIRGRQVVDLFGEAVQSTITTGDHYRKRHDAYKISYHVFQFGNLLNIGLR